MGAAKFGRPQIVELRVTLGQTASMPSPDAAARHTGAGVARRQAHHERMRDERAREAAAGDAELPPEDDAVEMASAVHVLDSVAEVGPNYTLLLRSSYGTKRRKCPKKRVIAGFAAPQPARAAGTHRLLDLCTPWDPGSAQIQQE